MRSVGERAGFGLLTATLTDGDATGYGVYAPRPDNRFAEGEAINAYVELYGYSVTAMQGTTRQMVFDITFTVLGPDGQMMTDAMVPMGEVVLNTYAEPLDGYLTLTYRITGVSGPAVVHTEITDRASGQRADFSLPVVFEAPPSNAAAGK